ncbi:TPA: hypothetical protein ACGO3D_002325 [Streptococcus suis]
MNKFVQKTLIVSSVCTLLSANCLPVLALEGAQDRSDVEYVQIGTVVEDGPTLAVGESFTFSNSDVLNAAKSLYAQGLLTQQEYQIIYAGYTQRLGVKGVNKVFRVNDTIIDVYIDNITWASIVGVGGAAGGLLLGAIPGINAAWASAIGTYLGVTGGVFFGAERGVIVRMKMVTEPPTQISGAKMYYKVIGVREQ